MPATSSWPYMLETHDIDRPMVTVEPAASERATGLCVNPSSAMTSSTRCRVAEATGRVWIEKLTSECTLREEEAPTADGSPLVALRRLISGEVLGSEAFAADMTAAAQELIGQLPPELRAGFGEDEGALGRTLAELAREGADEVVARLVPDRADGAD